MVITWKTVDNSDISVPDPEYYFLKPAAPQLTGYLGRGVQLSCLCAEDAQTCWLKDGEELPEKEEEEAGYLTYRQEGENVLEISRLEAGDSGQYTCKILKFGKEGEDSTSTWLNVIGNNNTGISIF